jgi:hypothetical protein
MSLDWSIENVENQRDLCWHKRDEKAPDGEDLYDLKVLTEALIHMTITVGMSKITEQNYEEFWSRVAMLEEVHGPNIIRRTADGVESVYITLEDVKNHIGLHTNAAPMSRTKFNGDVINRLKRKVEDRKRKEKKNAEAKAEEKSVEA